MSRLFTGFGTSNIDTRGIDIGGATIHLLHIEEGLLFPALDDEAAMRCRITGPTLVLWGRHGAIERCFNPLKDWAERAENTLGCGLDCGHYLAEEAPDEVLLELMKFLP